MTCQDISTLSPFYFCGELDPLRAEQFENHVANCPECALSLAQQREIDRKLRAAVFSDASDTSGIKRIVRENMRNEHRRRWIFAAATAAMLLCIAAFTLRLFLTQRAVELCTDAAIDHQMEIVEHQTRRWQSTASGMAAVAGVVGIPDSALQNLRVAGYYVDRAKLCRLNGRLYLHAVYTNGTQELSVYFGRGDASALAGRPTKSPNGVEVFDFESYGQQIASFRRADITTVVVARSTPRHAAFEFANLAAATT